MQEYTDILTGAPDGWIAEINTQLGGIHTLWMQFTADNRVSMMFDYVEYYRDLKASPFEVAIYSSHYKDQLYHLIHTLSYLSLQIPTS